MNAHFSHLKAGTSANLQLWVLAVYHQSTQKQVQKMWFWRKWWQAWEQKVIIRRYTYAFFMDSGTCTELELLKMPINPNQLLNWPRCYFLKNKHMWSFLWAVSSSRESWKMDLNKDIYFQKLRSEFCSLNSAWPYFFSYHQTEYCVCVSSLSQQCVRKSIFFWKTHSSDILFPFLAEVGKYDHGEVTFKD